jgi:hypothetical protein
MIAGEASKHGRACTEIRGIHTYARNKENLNCLGPNEDHAN